MTIIYDTKVKDIGPKASDFHAEKMIILFGEEAPPELAEYCYMINLVPLNGEIAVGDVLLLDDQEYKITAVGDQVNTNLANLAHITLTFNGATQPELAGTLYLEDKQIGDLKVGSALQIKKGL